MRALAVLLPVLLAGCGAGPARPPRLPAVGDDGIPLGALPRQALAGGECALFLWKTGVAARLVLMAKAGPPAFARIVLDGRPADLPRLPAGAGEPEARYGDGRVTASLDVTLAPREGLSDGAIVSGGSLRIERADGDGFVVPVSGLFACR